MYLARLQHGPAIQVHIPDGVPRSREGALHLQSNSPLTITDGEAEYLRKEMKGGSLATFPLVLDVIPGVQVRPAPQSRVAPPPPLPEMPPPKPAFEVVALEINGKAVALAEAAEIEVKVEETEPETEAEEPEFVRPLRKETSKSKRRG